MRALVSILVLVACACSRRGAANPSAPPPAPSEFPGPAVIATAPDTEPSTPIDDRAPPLPQGTIAASEGGCIVRNPPGPRSAGGLVVPATPAKPRFEFKGRLRSHVDGPLGADGRRTWIGPEVPSFVAIADGTLELFLLDPVPDGYFALYRDPYDASSCKLSGNGNCAYEVARFDCSGAVRFRVSLNGFFSRSDHLEVQDARLAGDVVYFNEACQSYSREAHGKCSSLVALDPMTRSVLWRTRPLTSNNRFWVGASYIVSGYGFTAEPDFLYVVRRSDGKVLQKESLPRAHEDIWDYHGALIVELDSDHALAYRRVGFDGPSPSLERIMPLERTREP